MKINRIFFSISILVLFLTGCNNPFSNQKSGIKCDDPDAVILVNNIINNDLANGKISIKVDTNNIVNWDYKYGRYLCKAKITGSYDKNITYLDKRLLNTYGLYFKKDSKVKGWIFYQTYLTTKEMEKSIKGEAYNFYIEVLDKRKVPVW